MSRRSKEKANERPLYSGRTSYIYLGVARRIIAILVVNVPLTLLAFAASILWTVFGLFGERELFTKLVEIIGGSNNLATVIYAIFLVALYASSVAALLFLVSGVAGVHAIFAGVRNDPRIFGTSEKRHSPEPVVEKTHDRLTFIFYRVYKDRLVITDYTGMYEWVYLLRGPFRIKVRQNYSGKLWNYGTVVVDCASFGNRSIKLKGIKDPHAFKSFLEANMSSVKVGVGAMVPHNR